MVIERHSSGPQLGMAELARPVLEEGEVRVDVRAASVNRADLAQLAGTHAPGDLASPLRPVGLDAAGEVVEIGSGVTEFSCGDRVMAMVAGGLAEEVVVNASMLIPIPANWSYFEGAAAVLGFMTAHNSLVTTAGLTTHETVAVHAATSGVGMQAVQLARYFGAGRVIGTTRSGRGADLLHDLGIDEVINTSSTDFALRSMELTGGKGVDVILDYVGGSYLPVNVRAAALRGRIVGIGRLGGPEGTLDMEALAYKRLTISGVTFRTRTSDEKIEIVQALRRDITSFQTGTEDRNAHESLRPIISEIISWNEASDAYALISENAVLGKIVLKVG
ncbi:NAD(P)H-quinone oxidoreductase [Rhodococcus sp. 008]|nr:NAD(P)H-quinone oxidoreductase [Rhodococcus sp. 008]